MRSLDVRVVDKVGEILEVVILTVFFNNMEEIMIRKVKKSLKLRKMNEICNDLRPYEVIETISRSNSELRNDI